MTSGGGGEKPLKALLRFWYENGAVWQTCPSPVLCCFHFHKKVKKIHFDLSVFPECTRQCQENTIPDSEIHPDWIEAKMTGNLQLAI